MTVNVRLPDDVHREIAAMAEQDDRSLNGEIVHAVRQFIAARKRERPTTEAFAYPEPSEHRATGRLLRAAEGRPSD